MSDTITVDKKALFSIIEEIDDKIEELEILISPEIVKEAEIRDREIEKGKFVSEPEIKEFFRKKEVEVE
ncbi:MAG: hypothetical protein QME59_05990 [Candidatus Hydrothermarchaeota archaeon]|nr:hypothetical protein [Candidatus Hydrothermarchaeota archaeon]